MSRPERVYHAFLSYSHADREIAMRLYRWLTADCGFKIWFDENNLGAGSPVAARLSEQMSLSRNYIVLSSKTALASPWVIAERDEALHGATSSPDFKIINLRIDDCDLSRAWSAVGRFNWIEAPGGTLSESSARDVIDRLDGREWSHRLEGMRDVYLSRGWRVADAAFADAVCATLAHPELRLRLIGDALDQPAFSAERVRDIIAGCSGHIAILPARAGAGAPTEADYKYFQRELELSRDLGIPQFLVAEPSTALPPSLEAVAYRYRADGAGAAGGAADFLEPFLEELREAPRPRHFFLAAEFRERLDRVTRLRDFVEAVTGVRCAIGRDFEGQGLRGNIAESIATSSLFLGNLSSSGDGGDMSVNANTGIEAGIAIGTSATRVAAGGSPLPVLLFAYAPEGLEGRTQRLPFMFRDSQITWYSNEADLLGHIRRLLMPYRRRILNFEFASGA